MTRLHRLVLLLALVGAAACAAAAGLLQEAQPVLAHDLPHGAVLAGVLLLAVGADLAHVRVRRGSQAEDLTVLEAAAPLAADGQRLGTLVLGTADRRRPLREDQLPLLVPLASALAVALQGAAQSRRLVEATSRLQAVVDRSSDGILVLDGSGTVELWSPALEALTGVPAAVAEGRPLPASLAVADGARADAGRSLLTPASPRATVELVVLRPDGQQRTVRCAHTAVFEDDGLVREVVLLSDVSREREAERLNADLVATVSHELRTPVTPIKGYADLLRRRGDDMTSERRQECLAVIVDRWDHLARLVEDLLLASRISANEGFGALPMSVGRQDLVPVVRRTAAQVGPDPARARVRALRTRRRRVRPVPDRAGARAPGPQRREVLRGPGPGRRPARRGGRTGASGRHRPGPGHPRRPARARLRTVHEARGPVAHDDGRGRSRALPGPLTGVRDGRGCVLQLDLGRGSTFVLEPPLAEEAPTTCGAPVVRRAARSLHAHAGLR
jgi:PAS domain S-box-containing protein